MEWGRGAFSLKIKKTPQNKLNYILLNFTRTLNELNKKFEGFCKNRVLNSQENI